MDSSLIAGRGYQLRHFESLSSSNHLMHVTPAPKLSAMSPGVVRGEMEYTLGRWDKTHERQESGRPAEAHSLEHRPSDGCKGQQPLVGTSRRALHHVAFRLLLFEDEVWAEETASTTPQKGSVGRQEEDANESAHLSGSREEGAGGLPHP
jgi:hypothetical protein